MEDIETLKPENATSHFLTAINQEERFSPLIFTQHSQTYKESVCQYETHKKLFLEVNL
jgi:hypothetical protein